MENNQRIQTTLMQLRREVVEELTYLMEGFFTNIEVRFFEIAGQTAPCDPELSNTIRELLSKREDITLGFRSALKVSVDNWFCAEKETIEFPVDDTIAAESACGVQAHFVRILELIGGRSRELVGGTGSLGCFPAAPEPLCCCFVSICRDICVEGISLPVTALLFRQLVLERLGDLYGRINSKLTAVDTDDEAPFRSHPESAREEIIEIKSVRRYASSASPA